MMQRSTSITTESKSAPFNVSEIGAIAAVLHTFDSCGASRDTILLCNALIAKGVQVTVVVLRNEGPLRCLLAPAIPIAYVTDRRARYAVPGLRQLFRAIAPQVILSSGPVPNLCSLAAVRSLPRAERPKLALREVASPTAARKYDPCWQSRIAYRILRRCYRYADRIVTLTEGARDDLVQQFSIPARKVVAMRSNAVVSRECAARIAQWDGERGRDPGLIVSVGRLSPEKDHRTLLRAVSRLSRNGRWHLALIGDGQERRSLESFARKHDLLQSINFVGFASNPFDWMMRARVAVCSSVYEGLCNAIIEALSCGTPVVSTDCPYGPREILQYGRYGTLVPVGDEVAMATAIEAALNSPVDRAKLMERGLNYTAERAADNFLEILADI